MKYEYVATKLAELTDDILVCFLCETEKLSDKRLRALNEATEGALERMIASGEFTGAKGTTASFVNPPGLQTNHLILAGLGEAGKLTADSFRQAIGTISRLQPLKHARSAAIHFGGFTDRANYQTAIEGYLLGSFKLLDYKTGDDAGEDPQPTRLRFAVDRKQSLPGLRASVERGVVIAEGQLLVRRLTQTPSNELTPSLYARKAQQLARKHGIKCQVLDETAIAREKMGGLLSVAKGSDEPPRFVILKYNGGRDKTRPVVLVGKGVTFDSGGISLKAGLNMHEMKQDMAGSAVILSTLLTAARLNLKLNLVGLMPLTENMPSGHATRPGDIITMRSGKTVEIINTDAEGRMILADALDYAGTFNPQAVIDAATLTGASLYVLGYAGAPIMGNDDNLLNRIVDAADETAERVWPLPLWDDFREQMKSPIADLVNSGGRPAGTAAAGAFLEYFVGDWPWAHIDLAYVDLEPKGRPYVPKGATGFGLRLLIEVLSRWRKL